MNGDLPREHTIIADQHAALQRNAFMINHTFTVPLRRAIPEPVPEPAPACCSNQGCYNIIEACTALHLDCIKYFFEQRSQPAPVNVFNIFHTN